MKRKDWNPGVDEHARTHQRLSSAMQFARGFYYPSLYYPTALTFWYLGGCIPMYPDTDELQSIKSGQVTERMDGQGVSRII